MLNLTVKNDIRNCYSNLKIHLEHFIPRKAQNYLVAELAKTWAGEYNKQRPIMVAEAGTGIGKSMAYLIATIPFALHNNKKVILSTATVALQEQLIDKDLPLFRRISPHPFSFALVKGRQRYCCAHKLSLAAQNTNVNQENLFDTPPQKSEERTLGEMHKAYLDGTWSGDKDLWPTPLPEKLWEQIVSDKHTCHPGLSNHRNCPFPKAREQLSRTDVLVVNHSVLMADLSLGGGVILHEPEKSLYILDEAHHLPTVARDFTAASGSLIGTSNWLEKINQNASKWANAADIKTSSRFLTVLQSSIQVLIPSLYTVRNTLISLPLDQEGRYRFSGGELPEELLNESKTLSQAAKKANQSLGKLYELLVERFKNGEISGKIADPLFAESAFFLQRLENLEKVWALMSKPNPKNAAPLARWIQVTPEKDNDFTVHVSPLEIGWQLEQLLWSRAAGVALLSATLRAMNSFEYFCRQVGLNENEGTRFLALPSPFDYQKNARLVIPDLPYDPSQQEFIPDLKKRLMEYLEGETASLVLFSSYAKMNLVADHLRKEMKKNGWHLHVQGESARAHILKKHRTCCAQGKISVIFGTSSFSEGLDLPGSQLNNLIITQIPFSVPTSPIEEAHAEYIEEKGGNPFLHISLPEASKKLIQAVGRLVRKEEDSGRVVLLDRRIISKRYGKMLLESLPPFNRIIE